MKRQINLEEYEIFNGEMRVIFTLDGENYYEDEISEDIFEEFVEKTDRLYYFIDRWDGLNETHYTEDKWMDYSEWVESYMENDDVTDFLESYYEKNKLPEYYMEE